MNDQLEKIISTGHHDPFEFLGVHFSGEEENRVTIRTFQPHASSVLLLSDNKRLEMSNVDNSGLFVSEIERSWFSDPHLDPYTYQYEIHFHNGSVTTINDPYRFLPQLEETDRYLFNFGTNYKLYEHLGCHPATLSKIQGTVFRVWAPNARSVSVIGNFNSWDGRVHPMRSLGSSGIWELFLPGILEGELYKFEVRTAQGNTVNKSDPFQFQGEFRPNNASIVNYLDGYTWQDDNWQAQKIIESPYDKPISIYELHPGSWRRDPDNPERFLSYRELAEQLIPYIKEMGFTHIELMPVMEHPLDESWGYQVTGPFSVTSRHGTPQEFMYFIDQCHLNSIGVILDWVPAHFPQDDHSLARFDGTALYEHQDPQKGMHPEWGTYIYNYGRREVSNYLIASALFWLDKFHIDGLRVDAVASMLYLDYSRKEGEWSANCYGGRENLEAIEFLRHVNSVVFDFHPNTLMIAEESTSFYGVSKPTHDGGLGFGFKWNMGWMNDILSYFSKDPLYRKYHHNILTFSIMYAFSENFILPLSHDEVVHGKKSLLSKMPGDEWQKYANLRLLLLTMWTHPGKKLLFMGGELGQLNEWNCKSSLDWHLAETNDNNQKMLTFVSDLNTLYKSNASLWELDFSNEGFQWLDYEDRNNSIISFVRYAKHKNDHVVCILNFTPQTYYDYKVGLPTGQTYTELFCSDNEIYGGSNASDKRTFRPIAEPYAQANFHSTLTIPPLAGVILKPSGL
ncbi:1,4-alpha-glucan branching protein GlgB [Desulfosediminicola flagellatus]|uniref:1,4-alpha-glucan branching protein GlgB n=1 Tax=Desulfosediminicola flagellatus TaxID=2569541 RepID=UPI0010ABB728